MTGTGSSPQHGEREALEVTAQGCQVLAEFSVPSIAGNEREVARRVGDGLETVPLGAAQLERLSTAVAEAAMNAIEHGNRYRSDRPVEARLLASERVVRVLITDLGGDPDLSDPLDVVPDLEGKLAGQDTPRGWGLFLIRSMVEAVRSISDGDRHTLELMLEVGGADGR